MMQGNRKRGAREIPNVPLHIRYQKWLNELSGIERLLYRLLQVLVVISLLIIVGYAAVSLWIKVPEVPSDGRKNPQTSDVTPGTVVVPGDEASAPSSTSGGRKEGIYTFLIAGRDVVSGSTDTMLLVSFNSVDKTVFGLNLPRDTMVNVSTSSKRLNAVYTYNRGDDKEKQTENGMAALKEQVANITGITPDFYAVVEWEAVGELVDALGGVEFEVPFNMDYDDPYQNLHIHQRAGLRVLSGSDAMQVIRHRKNNDGSHSNGDVGRLEVQQDFLKAVARKCLQPATLTKAPALAKIFLDNVKTDLTVGNILAFAKLAAGMDAETGVDFQTAPLASSFLYGGASMVTLNGDEILAIVNEKMNPYSEDIEMSDLELLYQKKDGSFGVTKGSLADPGMARASGGSASKTDNSDNSSTAGGESRKPSSTDSGTDRSNQTGTGTEKGGQSGSGTSRPGQTQEQTDSDRQEPLTEEQQPEDMNGDQTDTGEGENPQPEENSGTVDDPFEESPEILPEPSVPQEQPEEVPIPVPETVPEEQPQI